MNVGDVFESCNILPLSLLCVFDDKHAVCVFIFVLLGKILGRQTATRIHEQKA